MARQPKTPPPAPPEPPAAPAAATPVAAATTVVDPKPKHLGEVAALASAHAPFLYFDNAPNFGVNNGVVNVTLEAVRFTAMDQAVVRDRITVAHLRMSIAAAKALKTALEKALLLATPAANGTRN